MKLSQKSLAKYTQKLGSKLGAYNKLGSKGYSHLPYQTPDYFDVKDTPLSSLKSPLEKIHHH
jgi:hypothetical protein